jgi:hypothetical protein
MSEDFWALVILAGIVIVMVFGGLIAAVMIK